MTLRPFRPWELRDTIPLAEAFHKASEIRSEFSADQYVAWMASFVQKGALGAFGLFDGDKAVGMLIGALNPHFLVQVIVAQEVMWWVEPEYRSSLESIKLVGMFEQWAKSNGAFACTMASLHSTDTEDRLARLYQKRGYTPIESHYFKHL